MIELYTSRLFNRYLNEKDITNVTVKSSTGIWKEFAPTWDRVMNFKNGIINWDEYKKDYIKKLDSLPDSLWELVVAKGKLSPKLIFGCYCHSPVRCHRSLLCRYLEDKFPNEFIYKGEIPWIRPL